MVQAATGLEAARFGTISRDERGSLKGELSRLADKLGGIFISAVQLDQSAGILCRRRKETLCDRRRQEDVLD